MCRCHECCSIHIRNEIVNWSIHYMEMSLNSSKEEGFSKIRQSNDIHTSAAYIGAETK